MTDHKMFLGQLLQDNSILDKTRIRAEDFFTEFDTRVFSAIQAIFNRGDIADIVNVAAYNRKIDVCNLAGLTTDVISSTWKQVEKRILEASKRAKLLKIINIIKSEPDNTAVIAAIHKELDSIEERSEYEIIKADKVLEETINLLEKRFKLGGALPGIKSGIDGLDNATLGFEKRRLYVIGARPSQGKTAILLNFLHNCNVKAGVISAESSSQELMKRLISISGNIKLTNVSTGVLKPSDFTRIIEVGSDYSGRGIYFYDEPNMRIDTCLVKAREMKRRYGIEILFIDYLQCLSGNPKLPRHEQVAEISRALKALARRLEIPVVVSAQLRRDAEENRPKLSDFSDSTQIERDADVAVMIFNDKKKDKPVKTYLLIEKNRDGECRDIIVIFNKENMRFENPRSTQHESKRVY